jgi:hypothetical protein
VPGGLTASQGILEGLLKAQKLEDGEGHGGVEAQAALVGTESRVELHTISTVDLDFALVVFPGNAELDHTLGNGGDLEGGLVLGVLLEERAGLESAGNLVVGLLELWFRWSTHVCRESGSSKSEWRRVN